MHFTLWPSLTSNRGAHTEITWEAFLAFVAAPQVAADKHALEGWSPARFKDDTRSRAACELVSCIVLDDDASGLPLETVRAIWSGCAGVVHTSFSHTDAAPKYRVILRTSRNMTPDEHAHAWAAAREWAAERGQAIDEATKDPSRLWFVPGHAAGAPYAWAALEGQPLDVDAVLLATDHKKRVQEATTRALTEHAPILKKLAEAPAPAASRRTAMAAALAAAWPEKGRHEAQLALAGALRGEGWTEADAVDFLTAVAGDRAKREKTCAHTWARSSDAPLTGWTRLKAHVDPVLVDVARGALARDAEWTESTQRRLLELAAVPRADASAPNVANAPRAEGDPGPFAFKVGGFDAPLPPIEYQIDGYIGRGDVVMIVAHGNSLKTWLAFSLAQAVASGRPWLARFAAQRGRAAILDFESDDYEQRRRFKLLGVKDGDVEDRLLRSSYPAAQLTDPESWIVLAQERLDLVVIDSFNAASPGEDENDARSALLLQHAGRFANATRCTVIVIHHARKDGGDDRLSVRGSTALFAACDRIFKSAETETDEKTGVVTTVLKAIKPGAGKRPVNVRVELSDQGLRYVEEKQDAEERDKDNRQIVLDALKEHPTGISKNDLVDIMKGRREAKFEVIATLKLQGLVKVFRDSAEKREIVVLAKGAEL